MPIASMTWEAIDSVFQPKVYGTWLLDRATVCCPSLRFFIGYSSIASVFGPAAQANYAGANAFMDVMMLRRASQGRPGLSIGWGPWAEIGMAANLTPRLIAGIEAQGTKFLTPVDGMRAFSKSLAHSGTIMIGEFDWDRVVASHTIHNELYSGLAHSSDKRPERLDAAALSSLPRGECIATINEAIRARIASLLHFKSSEDVGTKAKFMELGLDSLVAVELKNALEALFGIALPTSIVFDYPSIDALTAFIHEQLDLEVTASSDGDTGAVAGLSDEEADAELLALAAL